MLPPLRRCRSQGSRHIVRLVVVAEIRDLFRAASDCGEEVSRIILEYGKLNYRNLDISVIRCRDVHGRTILLWHTAKYNFSKEKSQLVADIRWINGLVMDLQMFVLKSLQIPLLGRHPPSHALSNGSAANGWILLLEVNWIMRPGGYFSWAAQLVYKHNELQQEACKGLGPLRLHSTQRSESGSTQPKDRKGQAHEKSG